MKQADVRVGEFYAVRVSGRLAVVEVLCSEGRRTRSRLQYRCRNVQTGRTIFATAARLRPMKPAPEMGAVQVTPSGARELTMEEFMAGLREAAMSMPDTI